MDNVISTALGQFDKEKFNALLNVRATALQTIRRFLDENGFTEVTSSSLVNIAGSCENPHASFKLKYYKHEAHLSQSAQLQLEALVIRLKRPVYTVNQSFREENYEDPEAKGRRLSEFTLIEPEMPMEDMHPEQALQKIISLLAEMLQKIILEAIKHNARDIELLDGKVAYLDSLLSRTSSFPIITYDEALYVLNKHGEAYRYGQDLGVLEERLILAYFNFSPIFITHFPSPLKFFNMKRAQLTKLTYSFDLLTPRLGETAGGAVREEDGEIIKQQLLNSKIGKELAAEGRNPLQAFAEYFNLFKEEQPILRGGFGIGFERLIGFLLNSNDILQTIAYRSMQPE